MASDLPVDVSDSNIETKNEGETQEPVLDEDGLVQEVDKESEILEEAIGQGLEEAEGEHVEAEDVDEEEKKNLSDVAEELQGEELEGEHVQEEELAKEEQKIAEEEIVEEEQQYVEEPPDPTAPFDFSDSKEALREPFVLRPDQEAEVEQLWDLYQNYTPAYTDLDGFITEKELVYMLKAILLMPYTPEQLQELIAYCVRPPHPEGHINYTQFLRMVMLRQRDFLVEDELRSALQVLDPGKTGVVDREVLKELLSKQGHKMPPKLLENFIKEVDIANDGTIGVEDVVGTLCIDLNKEDLMMLMASLNPEQSNEVQEETF